MAVAFVRDHTGTSVKVDGTTNTNVNISTATGIGNLLVVRILFDNAAVASKPTIANAASIAKAAGETNDWVFLGAARSTSTTAGAFASGEQWAIRTSVSWPVANYTITLDTSVTMKAARVTEYSGATAILRSTSGTAYSTTTTAASATTTGTTPVIGDLALGFLFGSNVAASQAGDNDTLGGTWSIVTGVGSTGGSAATNNWGVGQDKILTTASHQTYNNSAAMTAGNGAIVAILKQYVDPAIAQAAYRFYADGTETGSTALAAQDATPTVDVSAGDVKAQLRVRLQSTTAAEVYPTDDFQLQWEKNGSGSWIDCTGGALIDSYPSSKRSQDSVMTAPTHFRGQTFLGNGSGLGRVGFWMRKTGVPGNAVAYLYDHTGTFGTNGTATGAPLATSIPVSDSNIPTSLAWVYFDFDSFTLTNGVPYVIGVQGGVDASNYMSIALDSNTASHAGNYAYYQTSWSSTATTDLIFELYSAGNGATPYNSANLTDGAATTNRLTGGTGSFTAGKVSEDGLADNVGWAGNNHTELLYSLTFKQADLANGDTLRFRVLRNGVTTGLTYTATPTVTITKVGGGPVTPVASFTASASTVTIGGTVTFTDTSTNTPTTWAWNFGTGASPATAATKGPHTVTYSTAGTSTVTLTAGNTAGSDAVDTPTSITVTAVPRPTRNIRLGNAALQRSFTR